MQIVDGIADLQGNRRGARHRAGSRSPETVRGTVSVARIATAAPAVGGAAKHMTAG